MTLRTSARDSGAGQPSLPKQERDAQQMIQVQPNKFGFGPAFGYGEWRKEQEEKEPDHMHGHQCPNCRLVFVQPIAKHQFCSHVT